MQYIGVWKNLFNQNPDTTLDPTYTNYIKLQLLASNSSETFLVDAFTYPYEPFVFELTGSPSIKVAIKKNAGLSLDTTTTLNGVLSPISELISYPTQSESYLVKIGAGNPFSYPIAETIQQVLSSYITVSQLSGGSSTNDTIIWMYSLQPVA